MAVALFDTLEYVKLLTQTGCFSQQQAEALNEAQMTVAQSVLSQVATQTDIKDLRAEIKDLRAATQADIKDLRAEIKDLRAATQADIKDLRAEIQADINDLRASTQADIKDLRAEIKACEHRLEKKIDAMKPFVYKIMVSIMLSNLTIIGIGIGVIALIVK